MTATEPSRSAQARPVSPNYEQAQHPLYLSATLCTPRLCFHGVTKPFFRNPFVLTSIQNPGGCGVTAILGNSICSQLRDKFEVSSFAATHTTNARLSPSAATHTKSPSRKSFPCHTSKNRGCGVVMVNHRRHSPTWNLVQPSGVQDTVRKSRPQLVRSQQGRPDARSSGTLQILRLRSRRPKRNLHPEARPGSRLLGPQWLRKKYHGKNAHRPARTHRRRSHPQRPEHPQRSAGLSQAARLRSGR